MKTGIILGVVASFITASMTRSVFAQSYSLTDIATVGTSPTSLSIDSAGNLYGLSGSTVFTIGAATHNVQTVATLSSANDGYDSPLTVDGAGDLFGTTGSSLYEIRANSNAVSSLYNFSPTSNYGDFPMGGKVVLDGSGNVVTQMDSALWEYSTATNQSTYLLGSASSNANSNRGGVTRDSQGNLYVTWTSGVVKELASGYQTNPSISGTQLANLGYNAFLDAAVSVDSKGNVFDKTSYGTIFEIPAGGSVETLANLNPGTVNPASPGSAWFSPSGVYVDAAGDIFGTEEQYVNSTENSAVFELPAGSSSVQTLASFAGTGISTDLVADSAGNLYGDTASGTVFELSPSAVPEPASLSLVAVGSLALLRRRR